MGQFKRGIMEENSDMYQIHESRLQQLEHGRIEVASQMSEQTAHLKSIKEDMCELKDSFKLANKSMESIAHSLQEHIKQDEMRLTSLEKREKLEENRSTWRNKLIYAAIGTMGSGLALLAERLFNH